MNISFLRFLLVALFLVVVQVWVLSPMHLFGWVSLWVYPVLMMFLPMKMGRIALLWIGFAIGSLVDYLMLTPGLHASATTLAFLLRYYMLVPMLDKNMNLEHLPSYSSLGGRAIILLSGLLLVHHVLLYGLDAGFDTDIIALLLRLGAGYGASLLVAILIMLFLSIRLEVQRGAHGK